jgi:N-acetylmuramoyl-L-alanine amidase
MAVLDPAWLSDCVMERVIVHWTAGTYDISDNDCGHYHFLIDKDGVGHKGLNPVSGNAREGATGFVTSHTKNCNTGSIGISVAAMGDAVESPFDPGPWPITKIQFLALALACAELCERYAIPVTPETLLQHGEVQENLGIKQDGKWDIGRLPFAPDEYLNSGDVGDFLRMIVTRILESGNAPVIPRPQLRTISIIVETPPGFQVVVHHQEAGHG